MKPVNEMTKEDAIQQTIESCMDMAWQLHESMRIRHQLSGKALTMDDQLEMRAAKQIVEVCKNALKSFFPPAQPPAAQP